MTSDFTSILLQKALETVITVAVPVLLAMVIKWVNAQIVAASHKVSREQLDTVYMIINQLVRAAEQSGLAGQIEKAGEAKKAYVLALLRQELEDRHISINLELLDAMIEAAVHDAFGKIDLDPRSLTDVAG
jgi:hypothetical protein